MKQSAVCVSFLCALLSGTPCVAQSLSHYTISQVGASSLNALPIGISNSGEIVANTGVDSSGLGSPGVYIFQDGVGRPIPFVKAVGISESGRVIGLATDAHGFSVSATYADGQVQFAPQGEVGSPLGVNDSGQVIGIYSPGGKTYSGVKFLPETEMETDLGTSIKPVQINNRGQVAAIATPSYAPYSTPSEAVLFSNGITIHLGYLPGDKNSVAVGIDSSGRILVNSIFSPLVSKAALYTGGKLLPLPVGYYPVGINDCGDVLLGNPNNANGGSIFSGGVVTDLASLLTLSRLPAFNLYPVAINNLGEVIESGYDGLNPVTYLFSPITPKHCGADVAISNTTNSDIVGPGEETTYTIKVANLDTPATQFTVTDQLSLKTSFVSCTISGALGTCAPTSDRHVVSATLIDLLKGGTATISVVARVAPSSGDNQAVANTATISSTATPDYLSTAYTNVRETADLAIDASLVSSQAGQLHYSLNVLNNGPDNAHAVLVLNPLPYGTTFVSVSTTAGICSFHPTLGVNGAVRCPVGNLGHGLPATIDMVLQANSSASSCPGVIDTATVTSQSIDPNAANDASRVLTPLGPGCLAATVPSYRATAIGSGNFVNFDLNNAGDILASAPPNNTPETPSSALLYKNGQSQAVPLGSIALNDSDEIVGDFEDSSLIGRVFLYRNSQYQLLDLGTEFYQPYSTNINNAGQLVGYGFGGATGFLYTEGSTTNLGLATDTNGIRPQSISEKSEITGSHLGAPFIYSHNLLIGLPLPPEASFGQGIDIDSSGRIAAVGGQTKRFTLHVHQPYIYVGSKIEDLSAYVGKYGGTPTSINDCGDTIGTIDGSGDGGFLYSQHNFFRLIDLLAPKDTQLPLKPIRINNRGQILATSPASYGATSFYLLTPSVARKCGSDVAINNTPNVATASAGDNITYSIQVNNLNTANSLFTVTDQLDLTTSLISCTVSGTPGSCSFASSDGVVSVVLQGLVKGLTTTITVVVKTGSTYAPNSILRNTATISSSVTPDYLSTAYTALH